MSIGVGTNDNVNNSHFSPTLLFSFLDPIIPSIIPKIRAIIQFL